MSDGPESMTDLLCRLQAAYEARENHTSISYCIDCDEVYTGIEPEACWAHELLSENHDSPILSAWIDCLTYLNENDLD